MMGGLFGLPGPVSGPLGNETAQGFQQPHLPFSASDLGDPSIFNPPLQKGSSIIFGGANGNGGGGSGFDTTRLGSITRGNQLFPLMSGTSIKLESPEQQQNQQNESPPGNNKKIDTPDRKRPKRS
jgi:hypothetical protein